WGIGKTFTAIDLAYAVMTADFFLGYRIKSPGGVLFIAPEGHAETNKRITGLKKERGRKGKLPFVWKDSSPILTSNDAEAELKSLVDEVATEMKQRFKVPLVMVFIDTMQAAAGFADDHKGAEPQKVANMLRRVAAHFGGFVFGVDHLGKDQEKGTL